MTHPRIDVKPIASALGAEVFGVDLAKPLEDESWSEIRRAFHEHLVLFFRQQVLTPEQQLTFARRFGPTEPYPFINGVEGYPELVEVVKLPDEAHNWGSSWHADMTYRKNPPAGAVLYAKEVPPFGGDTLFANMYLAYETLSPGMQRLVEQIEAVHDSSDPTEHASLYKGIAMQGSGSGSREVAHHPLVQTHPVTGRRSLYLCRPYSIQFVDMTVEETRPLLDALEAHATRPELTCRFRWEPNSVAVWDNRCAMHKAMDDDLQALKSGEGFRRVMHRATIAANASS